MCNKDAFIVVWATLRMISKALDQVLDGWKVESHEYILVAKIILYPLLRNARHGLW